MPRSSLVVFFALALCVSVAQAQQPRGWSLGGAVIARSPIYTFDSSEIFAVPLIQYEGERLFLQGIRGGLRFDEVSGWAPSIFVQPRFDGIDSDDLPDERLEERRRSADIGAGLSRRLFRGRLNLEVVTDLLGRSDGTEVSVRWSGRRPLRRAVFLTFNAGVNWWDQNLSDYYYGVDPSETSATLPAYEAGSALVPQAGVGLLFAINDRWSGIANTQLRVYPAEITDSPLVDEDVELFGFFGVSYRFSAPSPRPRP